MRSGRLGTGQPPARKTHSVIVFWVGPYRMGIEANNLKEIRNSHRPSGNEVAGATVVSSHSLFGVATGKEDRLLVVRPGRAAIRVDRVDRMIETGAILQLPRAFQGREREWYCGLVFDGDFVFPILDPRAICRQEEGEEAEAPASPPAVATTPSAEVRL